MPTQAAAHGCATRVAALPDSLHVCMRDWPPAPQGWDPSPQDMPAVVEIHNSVNERAWREVMAWERLHAAECSQCKLKRFSGKPDQYSPKARLMNLLVSVSQSQCCSSALPHPNPRWPWPPATASASALAAACRPPARLSEHLCLQGFKLPFDRHDWIVDRCGTEVRYIIDFYSGAPGPGGGTSMFLDARPALDSFSALWDRLRMQFSWVSSGRWRSE